MADGHAATAHHHLLARARARYRRLTPVEAFTALRAGALLDLGASRVTDVVGGFEAWRAAGLQ